MGLHTLHRETNLGLNQQCYKDVLLDTIITLYMRNRVHGAIVKCWLEVLESWTAGDRHQNYACPDALTASPPSPSFPHFPPDLSVAVPCDTGGITVQLIGVFLLDCCKSYAVVHE